MDSYTFARHAFPILLGLTVVVGILYFIARSRSKAADDRVKEAEEKVRKAKQLEAESQRYKYISKEEAERLEAERLKREPWKAYPPMSDEGLRVLTSENLRIKIEQGHPKAEIEKTRREHRMIANSLQASIGPTYVYNDAHTKITYEIADPSRVDLVQKTIHTLLENNRDVDLLEYQETLGIKLLADIRLPLPKPLESPAPKTIKGFNA